MGTLIMVVAAVAATAPDLTHPLILIHDTILLMEEDMRRLLIEKEEEREDLEERIERERHRHGLHLLRVGRRVHHL